MALDYFLLVFVASAGVIQIASIPARLRGLWLLPYPPAQYVLGAAAVIGSFYWFYTVENRNVQHTIEGAQQLLLFLGAAVLAYACTGIAASILRFRMSRTGDETPAAKPADLGMRLLKEATLLGDIARRLRSPRQEAN
jgi:hypothetical protein